MAYVTVHNSISTDQIMDSYPADGWNLCFQYCTYNYDDGSKEDGYRFIWKRPNGHLQAARGQARIPSIKIMEALMAAAQANGWGGHEE